MSLTLDNTFETADIIRDFRIGPIIKIVYNDEYYEPYSAWYSISI